MGWKAVFITFGVLIYLFLYYYFAKNDENGPTTSFSASVFINFLSQSKPPLTSPRREMTPSSSVKKIPAGQEFDFASSKKILYYTPPYRRDGLRSSIEFGTGNQPFVEAQCPFQNCFATFNHSLLPSVGDFDALIFRIWLMKTPSSRSGILNRPERKPNQLYVMQEAECPASFSFPYSRFNNFFNLTMTYRMDSDLPQPYGFVIPRGQGAAYIEPLRRRKERTWIPFDMDKFKTKLKENHGYYSGIMRKKTLMAAFVNSHRCSRSNSGRNRYIRDMQKLVSVDIMGGCGKIKCDRRSSWSGYQRVDNCSQAINDRYKFYLAFENSICDDYVTEKVWWKLEMMVVPVVLGGANYARDLPPHSYIDAADYDSPEDLANYLKYLDTHDDEYLSYFWWKDYYEVTLSRQPSFCQLCELLHKKEKSSYRYPDLTDWWVRGSNCLSPRRSEPISAVVEALRKSRNSGVY